MSPTPIPTMCSCFSSHFGILPLESELMVKSSGTAVSIQSLLDEIIRQSGISISVQHDPQKFRPVDYPSIAADISKLQRAIDWKPEISLERTIADTLTDWQIRLKNKVN